MNKIQEILNRGKKKRQPWKTDNDLVEIARFLNKDINNDFIENVCQYYDEYERLSDKQIDALCKFIEREDP